MHQIGYGENKDLRAYNQVWVECALPDDVDYSGMLTKNGDMPFQIPTDGTYKFATNPTQKKSKKGDSADDKTKADWLIGGAFKAVRIISDEEARKVVDDYNQENNTNVPYDYARKGGKEIIIDENGQPKLVEKEEVIQESRKKKASDSKEPDATWDATLSLMERERTSVSKVHQAPKSDANLIKGLVASKELDKTLTLINKKGKLGDNEIIYEIAKAMQAQSPSSDKSNYKYIEANDGTQFEIRMSNHQGNAEKFKIKSLNLDNNYGVVIKTGKHRFNDTPDVNYLEFVYFADQTDGARQTDIVNGLKQLVESGSLLGMPEADKLNASGKFKTILDDARDNGAQFSLKQGKETDPDDDPTKPRGGKPVRREGESVLDYADRVSAWTASETGGNGDVQDSRRRYVGGNSGYVGYSMSKRAAEARSEGRYPKTDFRKEYGLTPSTFDKFVELGMIDDKEWHHTSMYGNKTKTRRFYPISIA